MSPEELPTARTRCPARHTPLSVLLHAAAHATVSHSGCSSILPRTKTRWLKPPAGRGAVPGERQAAGLGPLCPKMVFLCPPWLLLNENFGIWGGEKYHLAPQCLPFPHVFLPLYSCHPPNRPSEGYQRANYARNIHPRQQKLGGQRERPRGVRCSNHRGEGKGFRV